MKKTMTREEQFQLLISEGKITGRETKDELRQICDVAGMFSGDPRIRRAVDIYKDNVVRKLARQDGWEDKDGNPCEFVNVIRVDRTTGKKTHMYLNLNIADFGELNYLVNDRLKTSSRSHDEAERFYRIGVAKFGRKFQKLFQFGPPNTDPSAN